MADEKEAAGGVAAGSGSATVSVPKFFKDNLGAEVHEEVSKLAEKDPEFAKGIPQTLPEFGKAWLSTRSQLAEVTRKFKEAEEGRKPPNSPADYALAKPELPKGMVYDDKLESAFRTWAHEEGLSAKAAESIFAKFNAAQIERFKAFSEEQAKKAAEMNVTRERDLKAMQDAVRLQWGGTYDQRMPRNLAALQNPVLVPPDLVAAWDQAGVMRKPSFHLWWDRIVSLVSSDRKLGLRGEEGEPEEEGATVADKDGKKHLKPGTFKNTAKRFPARSKAS